MKKQLLFSAFVFALFSCTPKNEKPTVLVDIDLSEIHKNGNSEKVFESARYVKLETTDDNLLGDNLWFYHDKKNIYILDRAHQCAMLTFSNSGKYLGKTGKKGRGPAEYPQCTDFIVRNDTVDFLTSSGSDYHIYSYLFLLFF